MSEKAWWASANFCSPSRRSSATRSKFRVSAASADASAAASWRAHSATASGSHVPPSLTDWNVSAENFWLASLKACRKKENNNGKREKRVFGSASDLAKGSIGTTFSLATSTSS